jgi:hypothetical protein
LNCHTLAAGSVLGIKTRQLNGSFTYPATGRTDNQLRTWNHLGLLSPAINESNITNYDQLVSASNTSATLEHRVRSYVDANCAHCHRPFGVPANFDARFDTPLVDQNIVNGPVNNTLGIAGAMEVAPGSLARSIMYHRLNTNGSIQMPPLARNVVDTNAVAVLAAWINSMGVAPSIVTHPTNQFVAQGTPAGFFVAAQGDLPLAYQWLFNSSNIPAATSTTISFPNTLESNEGNYFVIVTNAAGSVTSVVARLTVNVPPVFTPVTNRTIHQGMTVNILSGAMDSDLPSNVLTYALAAAPSGAAINSTNGSIIWTPAVDQKGTSNTFFVVATDNGVPNLSATNTFAVTVNSRPVILNIVPVTQGLSISWSAIPGSAYRLQYQTNLAATDWQITSNVVIATDPIATTIVPSPSTSGFFYRVQVLP